MTIKREDLATTDFTDVASSDLLGIIHPGMHLADYLDGACVTQYRLAKEIRVPARRINEIVKGQRAISADTALRLGRFFGTTAEFWMNLQAAYDLKKAAKKARGLEEIKPVAA